MTTDTNEFLYKKMDNGYSLMRLSLNDDAHSSKTLELSLRTPEGVFCGALMILNGELVSISSLGEKFLKPHLDVAILALDEMGINIKNSISQVAHARDTLGKWHSIHDIPPHTVFHDLDFGGISIESLPDDLTLTGDLILTNTSIRTGKAFTKLPERLSIGGNLDLSGSEITIIPQSLKVDGFLIIEEEKAHLVRGDFNVILARAKPSKDSPETST